MAQFKLIRNASSFTVKQHRVKNWPTWSKEISIFPWYFDCKETVYIVEGEVIVTPEGGEPVRLVKGDFASFPAKTSWTWDVRQPLLKHYQHETTLVRELARTVRAWLTMPEIELPNLNLSKLCSKKVIFIMATISIVTASLSSLLAE